MPDAELKNRPANGDTSRTLAHRLLVPSIADWVFVSILCWLFFGHAGATTLLGDGDTGWHIRTGEYVLANQEFPREDLFSFSMQGKTWFAWEWLSDVVLASVHSLWGLKGISLLAGIVIAGTMALLFRYMLWLEINVVVAIVVMLVATSASMVHWLARPHMFTWGLLLITIWLLEADRRRPSRRVYLLIPIAMVWTNLHGGFMTLLLALAIYAVGVGAEQVWARYRSGDAAGHWRVPQGLKRYGLLLLLCAAATLVNPYGYHLHEHIYGYSGSDFILDNVQEFQAPSFRGESQRVYEVVLLVSILLLARLARRREFASVLLVLAWAHASLMSVRHMPLFVMVAAPLIARELTLLLEEGAKSGSSWLKAIHSMAEDYGGRGKTLSESGPLAVSWLGVAGVALVAVMLQVRADKVGWKAEFSEIRFPTMACDTLSEPLKQKRVFSTDQWGDYLIYRFYPEVKVFFDGRSDFYAPSIRNAYLQLMGSHWGWEEIFERNKFEAALLPVDWSLAAAMKLHPGWRLTYDDGSALFFERVR